MTVDERRPVTDNEARAINAQPWEPLPGMVKLRRDPVIVVGASLGDQGGDKLICRKSGNHRRRVAFPGTTAPDAKQGFDFRA